MARGSRVRCAMNMKNAMPTPVPNRTAAPTTCTSFSVSTMDVMATRDQQVESQRDLQMQQAEAGRIGPSNSRRYDHIRWRSAAALLFRALLTYPRPTNVIERNALVAHAELVRD